MGAIVRDASTVYVGTIAENYERERIADPMWGLEHETIAPAFTSLFREGDRILDVAAGTGRWLDTYAAARVRPTLVDVSEDMLRIASEHAREIGCEIDVIEGSVFDMPSLPESDWLVSTRFFNWIPLRRIETLLQRAIESGIHRFAFTVRTIDDTASLPLRVESVQHFHRKNTDAARGLRRKGYYYLHPRPRLQQVIDDYGLRVHEEHAIERTRGDVYSLFLVRSR